MRMTPKGSHLHPWFPVGTVGENYERCFKRLKPFPGGSRCFLLMHQDMEGLSYCSSVMPAALLPTVRTTDCNPLEPSEPE